MCRYLYTFCNLFSHIRICYWEIFLGMQFDDRQYNTLITLSPLKSWQQLSASPAQCLQHTKGNGFIKCRTGHPSRYQDHKVWQLWNLLQHILTFQYFTDKGNEPKNYHPTPSGKWKMKSCFPSNVMPCSWPNSPQCQPALPPPPPHHQMSGVPQVREICPLIGCITGKGKVILLACGFHGS
jgi:hypothetical protein